MVWRGVLFSVAMLAATDAGAAPDVPPKDDADACQPDIHRLCETYLPDEKRVAGCLIEKRSELSRACAEALARPPQDQEPD